ncbi:MAG: DUF3040 domain-containing protein [Acidimicrobiales bacterium]
MPLSEHEQRILEEIERSFYEHDPTAARRFETETVAHQAARSCKWAGLSFAAGLALMLATFTDSVVLGAAGFMVMLVSSVYFERNLRLVGKAGWQELSETFRVHPSSETPGPTRRHLREHFKREP